MSENKKDILSMGVLKLTAPPPEGASRPANLQIKTWNNKVSVSVFTGLQNLPRSGIIGVNIDPYTFLSVLAELKRISKLPRDGNKITYKVEIYDTPKQDKKLYGTLVYGRDEKSNMYLCVVSPQSEFPKIVFRLQPPRHLTVSEIEPGDASAMFTTGFCDFWYNIIVDYLRDNYQEIKPQGNYGDGNNNRQSNSAPIDLDDIPY